jgi:hypothetical protein
LEVQFQFKVGIFVEELKTKIAVLEIDNSLIKNNSDDVGVFSDGGGATAAELRQRHEGEEG